MALTLFADAQVDPLRGMLHLLKRLRNGGIMSLADKLEALASKAARQRDSIQTEEACKTALILPFIQALGYDIFDPSVVIPEFTADFGTKKGEKVDYAVKWHGSVKFIIECKSQVNDLSEADISQLFRYFSVTPVVVGILTNGYEYRFFSDLDENNKMDSTPYLQFNILNLRKRVLSELENYTADNFDEEKIRGDAAELKYISTVKREFLREIESPSEDFVRVFASRTYDGRFTTSVRDRFETIVKHAVQEIVRDVVRDRLKSAMRMSEEDAVDVQDPNSDGDIITTPEELEAFYIIKAIALGHISTDRVSFRDAKSYCSIILDDSQKKIICRLYFNGPTLCVEIRGGEDEDRIQIDRVDEIFEYADRIKERIHELSE